MENFEVKLLKKGTSKKGRLKTLRYFRSEKRECSLA